MFQNFDEQVDNLNRTNELYNWDKKVKNSSSFLKLIKNN